MLTTERRARLRAGDLIRRTRSTRATSRRCQVAEAVRSLVAFDSVLCVDPALLLRAAEVYETDRIDFADAYLVACAESTGVGRIASYDRSLDRVPSIERVEPPTI